MTQRDPRWLEFPCTFTCEPLLFVLGRMLPRSARSAGPTVASSATEAARMLATETSRNVEVVDDSQLLVVMDEPFEAVSTARTHDLNPQRIIASGLALELLREPGNGPSSYTWTWLCTSLSIPDTPSYSQGLVRLPGLDAMVLPPAVTEIPAGPGVWLWILEGNGGDRVVFVDKKATLGRAGAKAADITVSDMIMSSRHATILPFKGTWAIEDRSLSGTYFDGQQVRSRSLVPGMVFHLGASKLVVLSVR